MKTLYLIGGLLFATSAFANIKQNTQIDCSKQIEVLKKIEGFSAECRPDNWQGSAGYGSGNLCKNMRHKHKRTISESYASEFLNKEFYSQYLKEVQQLKLGITNNGLCTLTMLEYNTGIGKLKNGRLLQVLKQYKAKKAKKQDVIAATLEYSCIRSAKDKQYSLNEGLFAKNGVIAEMLLGANVIVADDSINNLDEIGKIIAKNDPREFQNIKNKYLNDKELVEKYRKFCHKKNKSTSKNEFYTIHDFLNEVLPNG